MIEKYFKLGVRYAWDKPTNVDGDRDGKIVDSIRTPTPLTYIGLAEVVDPTLMISHVSTLGLQMNMPITYQWLDYAPGRTSRIKISDCDVISGFMSGCIIARWQDGGATYVGHIGTVEANAGVNKLVKDKCVDQLQLRSNPSFNPLGFNPMRVWDITELSQIQRNFKVTNPPQICALVTTGGEFYSFVMVQENAQKEWLCGGVKRVTPSQLLDLLT